MLDSPYSSSPRAQSPARLAGLRIFAWLTTALLSACGGLPTANTPGVQSTTSSTATTDLETRAAQVMAALPPPTSFDEAVQRAGEQLFREAKTRLGDESRVVTIDPLIDANTGAQTQSTVSMGEQLGRLLQAQHPQWVAEPLTRKALNEQPLLLIGTLTPWRAVRDNTERAADVYRVWLTLIDLRTGRIVAKTIDRATANSVNAEPVAYFRDSPTWHKDRTVTGYVNSCQIDAQPGDLIDPAYLSRLPAAALTQEAILAYHDGHDEEALRLYREAQTLADPDDLRVLNGLYLSHWRLGNKDAAAAAFSKIVESGLKSKRLPVKLLFQPGGIQLLPMPDLVAQYDIWLKALALHANTSQSCIKVVGHTSRTGALDVNEALSKRRAAFIEQSLVREQGRGLGRRLSTDGVGWRDNLIGLGTDDMRDVLDRRVEFRVVDCRQLNQRTTVDKPMW